MKSKNINKEIGHNINRIRASNNMTLQEVSNALTDLGFPMSVQTLSQLENNKRKLSGEQLYYICQALGCTPMHIIPNPNFNKNKIISDAVMSLSNDGKNIIEYCVTSWHGNSKALLKFVGLYISLPPQLRNLISGMGVSTYNYAQKTGQINSSAPAVDIVYITEQYKKLLD